MSKSQLVQFTCYLQPFLALVGLAVMHHRQSLRKYAFFSLFLFAKLAEFAILYPIYLRLGGLLTGGQAYRIYFYGYWTMYAVEAALVFFSIQNMFHAAMEPLKGLRKMGMLLFRWAAGISFTLALTTCFAPGISSTSHVLAATSLMQRSESVLVLSLLLFLTLAAKPLGLDYRSHIFGVSLGFGIMAANDLMCAAWIGQTSGMSSWLSVINGVTLASAMLVWIAYFAQPEPKRKLITLPVRSKLLHWDEIAQALGTPTPHVALSVGPEMFADGELQMMRSSISVVRRAS